MFEDPTSSRQYIGIQVLSAQKGLKLLVIQVTVFVLVVLDDGAPHDLHTCRTRSRCCTLVAAAQFSYTILVCTAGMYTRRQSGDKWNPNMLVKPTAHHSIRAWASRPTTHTCLESSWSPETNCIPLQAQPSLVSRQHCIRRIRGPAGMGCEMIGSGFGPYRLKIAFRHLGTATFSKDQSEVLFSYAALAS